MHDGERGAAVAGGGEVRDPDLAEPRPRVEVLGVHLRLPQEQIPVVNRRFEHF